MRHNYKALALEFAETLKHLHEDDLIILTSADKEKIEGLLGVSVEANFTEQMTQGNLPQQ